LARSVPLSRFTSRVGGGSAFYVRHHSHAMKKENLQKYASLKIVHNGTSVMASLSYSVTERRYIAMLPASGVFGTVQAEQIILTDDMMGRILCQPDGTISLDL